MATATKIEPRDAEALRYAGWMGHTHVIVRDGRDGTTSVMGQCNALASAMAHAKPGDRIYAVRRGGKGWKLATTILADK